MPHPIRIKERQWVYVNREVAAYFHRIGSTSGVAKIVENAVKAFHVSPRTPGKRNKKWVLWRLGMSDLAIKLAYETAAIYQCTVADVLQEAISDWWAAFIGRGRSHGERVERYAR